MRNLLKTRFEYAKERDVQTHAEQFNGRECGAATFLKTSFVKPRVARICPAPRHLNRYLASANYIVCEGLR